MAQEMTRQQIAHQILQVFLPLMRIVAAEVRRTEYMVAPAHFGLLAMPEQRMGKAERYQYYSKRALTSMRRFARERRVAYDRQLAERDLVADDNK